MAIEQLEKLSIIASRDLQDEVVGALTRLGTVHVERVVSEDCLGCKELSDPEQDLMRGFTFELSKVDFLISFLEKYRTKKRGFVSTLIKPKHYLTFEQFFAAREAIDLEQIYQECFTMDRRFVAFSERVERLERELEELEHWVELEIPMGELVGDPVFRLILLRVAVEDLEELSAALEQEAAASSLEVVSRNESWAACILLFHPETDEDVTLLLSRFKHQVVTLRDLGEEPVERYDQIRRDITAIDRRRDKIADNIARYQALLPQLEIVHELLLNKRLQLEATTGFGVTKSAVVIEGWVTSSAAEETITAINTLSDEISIERRPPRDDELPPVSLKNRDWFKPFEILTVLYGVPNNREYDPTWIVALSFVLFFGFCIADVGYGAVIIVAFLLMRAFLPLGQKVKNLLLVLSYGGAMAMVFGVLTGSWFGINPASLPSALTSLQVFDPLQDPVPVMAACMVIGLVHMLSGTVIEARDNLRAGNYADALIDQGLVMLLFVGSSIFALLAVAGLVPFWTVFACAGAAVGGMIVLGGHANKSVPGKMFGGLYETYNTVVGWMGDTVSYLRLFALGLATFAVAWVINTLSGMARGIAPVIGILLMLLILVFGHTFNLAVNLLSAFVHPLRLEYVEFFGKFYEDGGRGFTPLEVQSKTVFIEELEKRPDLEKGGGP